MGFTLPPGCVLVNQVTIAEYLDNETGDYEKYVLCEDSAGEPMSIDRILFLLEWAKAMELAPLTAQIIAQQINEYDDEDADDDDS